MAGQEDSVGIDDDGSEGGLYYRDSSSDSGEFGGWDDIIRQEVEKLREKKRKVGDVLSQDSSDDDLKLEQDSKSGFEEGQESKQGKRRRVSPVPGVSLDPEECGQLFGSRSGRNR